MTKLKKFENHLERAHEIAQGKVTVKAKQRLEIDAEQISRASDMAAHMAVTQAAMMQLIPMLYELNAAGRPANYDRFTGQILVPVPWGKNGYQIWGLRCWEADVLRRILLDRSKNPGNIIELFDYNEHNRRWCIMTSAYPTVDHAMQWLKTYGPTAEEWQWSLDISYKQRAARRGVKIIGR